MDALRTLDERNMGNRFRIINECWRKRMRACLECEDSVGEIGTTKVPR